MTFDFPALGTHWWFEIWDDLSHQELQNIQHHIMDVVNKFEDTYSRFLPNSVISELNRKRTLELDSESLELLRYGVDLFQRTHGVFNILVGHILEARGYDKDYSLTDHGSQSLTAGNPMNDIEFNDRVVHIKHGHVDIGGYGKGWLIDKLHQHLKHIGVEQHLINGGGDIYVTHQDNNPVDIYLEDPINPKKLTGKIQLKNSAFAGSSPHKRAWSVSADGAEQQHHIVSMQSVKDVIYLTAPTAVDADAFATTLLQTDAETTERIIKANSLALITTQ